MKKLIIIIIAAFSISATTYSHEVATNLSLTEHALQKIDFDEYFKYVKQEGFVIITFTVDEAQKVTIADIYSENVFIEDYVEDKMQGFSTKTIRYEPGEHKIRIKFTRS